MKRYVDFRADDWVDRTDSHMQAVRWTACTEGLGSEAPLAGVLDDYPLDLLAELIEEGWVAPLGAMPDNEALRDLARIAVMSTLKEDADCLATEEHTLVERMLIGEGRVKLETVAEMEAAYTLRMRLWCDLGVSPQGMAEARLDPLLMQALPALLMRPRHVERRSRIFVFEGMLYGLLYIHGYLDDRIPVERFVEDVLQMQMTRQSGRLAHNYLEATFDTYEVAGCNLLVHEAMADPEVFAAILAEKGAFLMREITSDQLTASMNGMLPEEVASDEKLQRALLGALRPEYEPGDVTSDLRFLAKQGAPMDAMREILASMLCVLPTDYMEETLDELHRNTPQWVGNGAMPSGGLGASAGTLH